MSLYRCIRALEKAETAMIKELARLFPIGSSVHAVLMHGQVNPSEGVVIGHRGGRHAYILVRLESRTRQVRAVAVDDIWDCYT